MKRHIATALAAAALCGAAFADTIHMKNGTQVNGKIVQQDSTKTVVAIGDRTVYLRSNEVLQVEKNNRTGRIDLASVQKKVDERNEELRQSTGMTKEQFAELRSILQYLQSNEPAVYQEAQARLVELGNQVDLVSYFETQLPRYSPRFVPRVLEVIFALDPSRAVPIARKHVFDLADENRLKAIDILVRGNDQKSLDFFVRGLVDRNPDIRMISADGIELFDERRATPLLLANLKNDNRRVQNSAQDALMKLWGPSLNAEPPQDFDTWTAYWNDHAKSEVSKAYELDNVAPLVAHNDHFEDE